MKIIATHLGKWEMWDEVAAMIIGKPIYTDISYSFEFMAKETARQMILNHFKEYILFGTDSPWEDQATAVKKLKDLGLVQDREKLILREKVRKLLESV